MAIKPILFNTEMVRAILDGRKTQTRRLPSSKIREKWCDWDEYQCAVAPPGSTLVTEKRFYKSYPPYEQGDILWVRETWAKDCGRWLYKADYPDGQKFYIGSKEIRMIWSPSIHMTKEAARLFLRVNFVRIGRLQGGFDASCAYAEGIAINHPHPAQEAVDEFIKLWNSTTKSADLPLYGWDANPWVWVIGFVRINKPAGLWADRDTSQFVYQDVLMPATRKEDT